MTPPGNSQARAMQTDTRAWGTNCSGEIRTSAFCGSPLLFHDLGGMGYSSLSCLLKRESPCFTTALARIITVCQASWTPLLVSFFLPSPPIYTPTLMHTCTYTRTHTSKALVGLSKVSTERSCVHAGVPRDYPAHIKGSLN